MLKTEIFRAYVHLRRFLFLVHNIDFWGKSGEHTFEVWPEMENQFQWMTDRQSMNRLVI